MHLELYPAEADEGENHELDDEALPTNADVIGHLMKQNRMQAGGSVHRPWIVLNGRARNGTTNGAAHNGVNGSNGHAAQVPDYRPILHTDDSGPAFDALRTLGLE